MWPGRDYERRWKSREDILWVRRHKLLPGGQASVFIKKKKVVLKHRNTQCFCILLMVAFSYGKVK